MKILLDTHTLLWALEGSDQLPFDIQEMICEEKNEIYVSSASLWEIAIKHKKNPDKMFFSSDTIREYSQRAGYIFLSINLDAIHAYEKLDLSNDLDPFDQILASQAYAHNMILLTHDKQIAGYNLHCTKLF